MSSKTPCEIILITHPCNPTFHCNDLENEIIKITKPIQFFKLSKSICTKNSMSPSSLGGHNSGTDKEGVW